MICRREAYSRARYIFPHSPSMCYVTYRGTGKSVSCDGAKGGRHANTHVIKASNRERTMTRVNVDARVRLAETYVADVYAHPTRTLLLRRDT